MKLVQTKRDNLLRPLQAVSGIVEKRHTLPILSNVLFERSGDALLFLATDLEIQVSTSFDSPQKGSDNYSVTVSARKLIDILRALPDNIDVSLKVDDKRAALQAGRSRFSLQTMPVEDFPLVSTVQDWPASFRMPQKQLRNLFQMVHFAMAVQDVRYYLNGLQSQS